MKIQICSVDNMLVARELNQKCASKFKQFEFFTSFYKHSFSLYVITNDNDDLQFIEMIKLYCIGYIEGRQNLQLEMMPNYHYENGKMYRV